ncbi:MAG: ABC transporter ATP-binding protein [Minwuia sp.]|nr:ABC transporter ATP-binding protein [Minwuia sp.]
MTDMTGLEIRHLTSDIVDVSDITVLPGRPIALVGPSGSGKSSLLRAIVDLDRNAGDVRLNGIRRDDLTAPEWRRRVIYIPAEPGWWGDLVGDHLNETDSTQLRDALGLSHIKHSQPIEQLSTGERQRLALALGLARHPTALLLDEPTAALDEESRTQVESLLDPMIAAGLVLIMATHDPEQARRLGLERLEIVAGRIGPDQTGDNT